MCIHEVGGRTLTPVLTVSSTGAIDEPLTVTVHLTLQSISPEVSFVAATVRCSHQIALRSTYSRFLGCNVFAMSVDVYSEAWSTALALVWLHNHLVEHAGC